MNRATVLVQTSRTRASACRPGGDGRRHAGRLDRLARQPRLLRGRGELPDAGAHPAAVAEALRAVLSDSQLRDRLRREGLGTAADYAWEKRIDELEAFLRRVAEPVVLPRREALSAAGAERLGLLGLELFRCAGSEAAEVTTLMTHTPK